MGYVELATLIIGLTLQAGKVAAGLLERAHQEGEITQEQIQAKLDELRQNQSDLDAAIDRVFGG